jgi:hypothetical protein
LVDQRLAFKIILLDCPQDLCWSKRSTKIGATGVVAPITPRVFWSIRPNHRSNIFGQHSPMPDMPEVRPARRVADVRAAGKDGPVDRICWGGAWHVEIEGLLALFPGTRFNLR